MSDNRLFKLKQILERAVQFGNLVQSGDFQVEDTPNTLKDLWKELEESNTLQEDETHSDSVTMPVSSMQEFLTELKILQTTCVHLGHYTRQLCFSSVNKFTTSDYAAKLLAKFSTDDDDGEIDWVQMTSNVIHIINRAPGITMLNGTMDAYMDAYSVRAGMYDKMTGKKRPRPKMSQLKHSIDTDSQNADDLQVPDKILKMEEDTDSVDSRVKYIQEILHDCYEYNDHQPISFYKFILHPTQFTSTIENIFHTCFLIRDGLARLDILDDELVIEPAEDSTESQKDGFLAEKHQMVFSITMDEWKNLVEVHKIEEPAIE